MKIFFQTKNLSLYSIFGTILTLAGIAITILNRNSDEEKIKLNMPAKGFMYALGGAAGQSFGLVLSKKGMAGYDAFAATQIRIITGIIGFSAIIILFGRVKQTLLAFNNKKGMTSITIGSFFGPFLGVSISLYSIKFTATGIASTIMATVPILIIPPAIIFFKQKITIREIIGATISVIGIALFFIK